MEYVKRLDDGTVKIKFEKEKGVDLFQQDFFFVNDLYFHIDENAHIYLMDGQTGKCYDITPGNGYGGIELLKKELKAGQEHHLTNTYKYKTKKDGGFEVIV